MLAVEALVVPVEFVVEELVPVVLLALEAGVLCSPSIVPPRCLTFDPRPPRCHTRRKLRETENKSFKIPVTKILFHSTIHTTVLNAGILYLSIYQKTVEIVEILKKIAISIADSYEI